MSLRNGLMLAAASVLAVASVTLPALARDGAVTTTEFSAQAVAPNDPKAKRSGYRVRRGNGWHTFVALGALGTIAIGASQYYPYAYIQAPEPYCDGRRFEDS